MSRILCVLTLLALPAAASSEDEAFDLWRVPTPEGYKKTLTKDVIGFTRIEGATFLQMAIYKSRPVVPGPIENEFAKEWKEVVEVTFKPGPVTKLKPRRFKCGVVSQGAMAELKDKNDAPYYGALFVVAPYGHVVSIVVTTTTAETFKTYDPAIAAFMDSLTLDVDAIAKQAAEKAGKVPKPEEIQGRWATSRSGNFDPFLLGLHHGSDKRQYDFKKDGTYTFHLEAWGGSYRSDEYFVMDENGTYAVDGNKVTVTPQAGTSVQQNRAGEIQKKYDAKLETTTYLWQFYFFTGIQENNLVLTPPGETARDCGFASNDLFSRSYLLSGKYNPEWTKFGK